MSLGIGRIAELVRNEASGNLLCQLFRLYDRTAHAQFSGSQDKLRTVSTHEHLPLGAHGIGHDNDGAVASCRRHAGKTDARITGSGFNDGTAFLQKSLLLCIQNHGKSHTVLGRTGGIKILQLYQHSGT